jgi:hypothetical protein
MNSAFGNFSRELVPAHSWRAFNFLHKRFTMTSMMVEPLDDALGECVCVACSCVWLCVVVCVWWCCVCVVVLGVCDDCVCVVVCGCV